MPQLWWMIYFVTWNNYLKCHHITDGHTDGISLSAFHREFENNYLKCHQITDGYTDGLSPSAFHREFENNYLKCHSITDGHTDGLSPSAFHREFENNYLKCHPIIDGHTDEFKSGSRGIWSGFIPSSLPCRRWRPPWPATTKMHTTVDFTPFYICFLGSVLVADDSEVRVDADGSVGVLLEQGCCWSASSVGGRRAAVGFCGGQSTGKMKKKKKNRYEEEKVGSWWKRIGLASGCCSGRYCWGRGWSVCSREREVAGCCGEGKWRWAGELSEWRRVGWLCFSGFGWGREKWGGAVVGEAWAAGFVLMRGRGDSVWASGWRKKKPNPGGRRRLVCICEWEWGGWFRRKKIKAGRGAAVWVR